MNDLSERDSRQQDNEAAYQQSLFDGGFEDCCNHIITSENKKQLSYLLGCQQAIQEAILKINNLNWDEF
jgi:hypothetical protein